MKHKGLILLSAFAVACGLLTLSTAVYSAYLLTSHWQLAMEPCVECAKTFWQHWLVPSNLVPLVLFGWSVIGLTRGVFFVKREYQFQRLAQPRKQRRRVQLIDDAPLAAWSSGFFRPYVCVHTSFWQSLTATEKKALCAHEGYHVDHKETMSFLLLGFCTAILPLPFFTNGIHAFLQTKRIRSEIAADNQAIEATSRVTLASLLRKALEFELGQPVSVAPAINSFLEQRIRSITQPGTTVTTYWWNQWLLPMTLGAIITVVCTALYTIEPLQGCL